MSLFTKSYLKHATIEATVIRANGSREDRGIIATYYGSFWVRWRTRLRIFAFVALTAAEVMVSVTHLEFAYTQAPKKLKSLVMCTYLGAVALGNVFTAAVNFLIQNKDGTVKLKGASYFFFFVGVMLVTSVLFLFFARFYKGRTHIQEEAAT